MKKLLSFFIFIFIIFLLLANSYSVMENIRFSFSLCINNLFPSLIPFMLISNILINYNFIDDLSDIFKNIMIKVFKVNKNCAFAFIMSLISGTPSNAKYLKDLLNSNLISIKDCQSCLNFCHFTNPIFIIGTIGFTFFNDKKIGLVILFSHYLSSIIIGLFNKKSFNIENYKLSISKNKNFINILKEAIKSTTDTLFLILGIITTCIIITSIIDSILPIKEDFKFIYGLLEVTQGLKYLSISNLSLSIKAMLSSALISFGGICIHGQVFSILDNKKIRYLPYLISRVIHSILSSTLTLILIKVFY